MESVPLAGLDRVNATIHLNDINAKEAYFTIVSYVMVFSDRKESAYSTFPPGACQPPTLVATHGLQIIYLIQNIGQLRDLSSMGNPTKL